LYQPTAQEIADFEAFDPLCTLIYECARRKTDRIPSWEAGEMLSMNQVGIAALLRPAGVQPRTMRQLRGDLTLKSYSVGMLREGLDRLFRRYTGEPSGIEWPRIGNIEDFIGNFHLYDLWWDRVPLFRAWKVYLDDSGDGTNLDGVFPTDEDEYTRYRYGTLYTDADERRGPGDESERREVKAELRALSRPRS
jgi:hypothetical protein